MKLLSTLVLAAALALAGGAADAANPLKPAKFVWDPAKGYILARVGPTDGGKAPPVYFARLGEDGDTIWSFGGRPINNKKNLDAAMVWGGDHFGTDGTTSPIWCRSTRDAGWSAAPATR